MNNRLKLVDVLNSKPATEWRFDSALYTTVFFPGETNEERWARGRLFWRTENQHPLSLFTLDLGVEKGDLLATELTCHGVVLETLKDINLEPDANENGLPIFDISPWGALKKASNLISISNPVSLQVGPKFLRIVCFPEKTRRRIGVGENLILEFNGDQQLSAVVLLSFQGLERDRFIKAVSV